MPSRYTIKDVQLYAADHNGRCLSKEYIDQYTPLTWQCEKGHTWEADFIVIRQGGWCKQCLKQKEKEKRWNGLIALVKEKGGKCLSKKYTSTNDKYKIVCSAGHKWFNTYQNLMWGTW